MAGLLGLTGASPAPTSTTDCKTPNVRPTAYWRSPDTRIYSETTDDWVPMNYSKAVGGGSSGTDKPAVVADKDKTVAAIPDTFAIDLLTASYAISSNTTGGDNTELPLACKLFCATCSAVSELKWEVFRCQECKKMTCSARTDDKKCDGCKATTPEAKLTYLKSIVGTRCDILDTIVYTSMWQHQRAIGRSYISYSRMMRVPEPHCYVLEDIGGGLPRPP